MRNIYAILMGKSEGKGPLSRPRHRCEVDTVKMDFKEIMDWIQLA
jgi:hypothetical protein